MTHLKKSLAVLLAFVMIFSTMSIAASAFDATVDGGFDIGFTVVMFRKDSTGNWIQTTKAKPGEELKAVLFVDTDYYSNASTLAFAWNKDYISSNLEYSINSFDKVKLNGDYASEVVSLYTQNAKLYSDVEKKNAFSFAEDYGYLEKGYLDLHDILSVSVQQGGDTNFKWNGDTWAIEINLTVNDNAFVRNSANSGEVRVPDELAMSLDKANRMAGTRYRFLINVPKGEEGGKAAEATPMRMFNANITSTPGVISVFSDVKLNANGGKFADNSASKNISGVIGDTVTGLFDNANVPTNGGKQFLGWARTPDAENAMTQEQLANFAYDYDEQELFALWSDEVTNTSWKYEVYKMVLVENGDGTYRGEYVQTPDYVSPSTEVAVNTPINAPVEPETGFVLDTEKSVTGGVAQAGSDNVLKVYYKRELHTVTYYDEDGSIAQKFTDVPYGAPVPAISDNNVPTKEGHTLTWEPTIPPRVGTEDLAFTAKFTPVTYTYTFNANGGVFADGSVVKTMLFNHGDATKAPDTAPTKEGYVFTGWKQLDGTAMPEKAVGDLTLYAQYEPATFTVSFDSDGGSAVPSEDHKADEEINSFPTPTKDNAIFVGWTYNGQRISYPFTMPASNITLKAAWEYMGPINATLTYEFTGDVPAGAETLLPAGGSYEAGQNVTLADKPTFDGYEFHGWFYRGEQVSQIMLPADGATVTGYWTEIPAQKGTINFYDGDQLLFTKTGNVGEQEAAPVPPTKEGYTFVCWTDANGGEVTFPVTYTENTINVYAKWEASELTVTYYLAIGAEDPLEVQTYETGDAIIPAALPEGYECDGWVDADGNPLPAVMGTKSLVVYPKNLTTKSYNLTFDANGGHFGDDETNTSITSQVLYGSEIKRPDSPVRDGYVFAGWEPNVEAVMPNHDLTYTAKWETAPVDGETYSAVFLVDGVPHAQYVLKEGDVIPVPADPQKFGYKFKGWEPEVPSTMPAHDVEFVATWEVDKEFVTVIIGGVVISGGVIAAIAGINASIIAGIGIIGGIITITIIAKNTYTVKYIVDGETYKTYKVLAGTKIPVPADPTKEGYVFDGWDPEVPDKMPAADQTFTAKWKAAADDDIPATGSASAGLAAFGIISAAAAAAYVITKKKKED